MGLEYYSPETRFLALQPTPGVSQQETEFLIQGVFYCTSAMAGGGA